MAASLILRKMTCFKLGDGFSIGIWEDPWVKNMPNAIHICKGRN